MKGLLITGGEGPSLTDEVKELVSGPDIVAAADSGASLALKLGIMPDYIIGDLDSLENAENILKEYPPERVLRYGRDKDYTDTELALSFLHEKGCDEVVIAGGSGGRTDHFIGILSLFYRDPHPRIWIMRKEILWSVEGTFSITARKGETVSLFPVPGSGVCRMKSRGLKWELDSLVWKDGDAGISNIAENSRIIIEMISGRLLLVKQIADPENDRNAK